MEFKTYIDDIADFIELNLPAYLDALKVKYTTADIDYPNKYVEAEYPDVDKYTSNIVFYILTPEFLFEELSNESKALENTVEIYVTFKGKSSDKLKELSMIYAEAIFALIKDNSDLGASVDYAMISKLRIFEGVEGSNTSKALFIELKAVKEI